MALDVVFGGEKNGGVASLIDNPAPPKRGGMTSSI